MIDTTKTIREVRYNGTAIPLLGGVDNPIVVTSDAEMETCLNDDRYLGMYVKFNGESENYLNGQVYKIAQEGEVSKFYQLPTLDNEGTAADLVKGKQLISSDGKIIIGTTIIENKLNQFFRKTVVEVTEEDLAGVTSIPDSAFLDCIKLKNVVIGDSVTSISRYAFKGCTNLVSIIFGNKVKSFNEQSFYMCKGLTNIVIPDSVTNLGRQAFYGCSGLTNVTISNNVTDIPDYTFRSCTSLIDIIIPNNVTSIGEQAFNQCTNLTDIIIPNKVTRIKNHAFYSCSNLENIILLPTTPPTLGSSVFGNISSSAVITVPKGTLNAYQTATNWSTYADKMVEASN